MSFAVAALLAASQPAPADPFAAVLGRLPAVTRTKDGRPGDPVNLLLAGGARDELTAAFRAAGWFPAAPVRPRSAAGIAASVVLDVPYRRAPVSDLYLFGRAQDLAFEKPCGRSARSRHHVRFWCAGTDPAGRPVWAGAATFDASVGRSEATGKFTHHIAPDVDRERDTVLDDLTRAGRLTDRSFVGRSGPFTARNGEGDPYHTDGRIAVGTVGQGCR